MKQAPTKVSTWNPASLSLHMVTKGLLAAMLVLRAVRSCGRWLHYNVDKITQQHTVVWSRSYHPTQSGQLKLLLQEFEICTEGILIAFCDQNCNKLGRKPSMVMWTGEQREKEEGHCQALREIWETGKILWCFWQVFYSWFWSFHMSGHHPTLGSVRQSKRNTAYFCFCSS